MTPILFINCSRFPFVDQIMSLEKPLETRKKDMLRNLVGKRVLIAETCDHVRPLVKCSAFIEYGHPVYTRAEWDLLRKYTRIEEGSSFDWTPSTSVKWVYRLTDVRPVDPFNPPEGSRHGRVWMEYDGDFKC